MKSSLVLFFLAGGILSHTAPVFAHGVKVEHRSVEAIAVAAQYDSGEPMTEAQVLVYGPDNASQPWLTGVTDKQGKFTFTPAGDHPGNWEIVVRQGGHGAMVTIPWQAGGANGGTMDAGSGQSDSDKIAPEITIASVPNASALSPIQRGITIGAVIWGFVGTALFFAGKSQSHSKGRT